MITDKLFLAWDCSDCTKIKTYISGAMFDDSTMGLDGQSLTVIHTFSNGGTRDVLDIFGLNGDYTPVLLTHKEEVISDLNQIISYLEVNGFTK